MLPWPPQSPDLSPIENIWGYVSEKVYKEGKTYKSKDELWKAIVTEWEAVLRGCAAKSLQINDKLTYQGSGIWGKKNSVLNDRK